MTVYCDTCDNVHGDTRKGSPWTWRCVKAPILQRGFGYVSQNYAPDPPYEKCDRTNTDGNCPMFTPLRVAPEKVAA